MDPITYLDSLIAGMKMNNEIPVQLSELELLRIFLVQEREANPKQ